MVHWMWSLLPSWGNTSPAHAIGARLLEANSELKITFIHIRSMKSKVEPDWLLYPEDVRSRAHNTYIGREDTTLADSDAFAALVIKETSELIERLKGDDRPSKFFCDQGMISILPAVLEERWPKLEVWVHTAASAQMLHLCLAPAPDGMSDTMEVAERLGGGEETLKKLMMTQNGKLELDGTLVKLPGAPDLFDWERPLTNTPALEDKLIPYLKCYIAFSKTGHILVSSSSAIEAEAFKECRKYHSKIIAGGSSLNPRAWDNARLQAGKLKTWLDSQAEDGTIAVCFGSSVFPVPAEIEILIDALIDSNVSFVLVTVDKDEKKLSRVQREKVRTCPRAFLSEEWTDLVGLYNHPAIRAALWHGGWNTFGEVMLAGKIMIGWPLASGDEPVNTNWAATRARPIAFELLQIRHPKHPARRGVDVIGTPKAIKQEMLDVFAKAAGVEGDEIKRNVAEMAMNMRRSRHGADWEALQDLAFS